MLDCQFNMDVCFIMRTIKVKRLINEGDKYSLFYNPHNSNNKTIHIVSIINDECIVIATYNRRKGWIYECKDIYFFIVNFNYLKYRGKSKKFRS